LIVIDSRKRRDGAAIEEIGWYNPIDKGRSYEIKSDRLLHWLEQGAIASNAAKKLMKRDGLSLRWHLMQQGVDEKEIEKEMKKWELNREEVLALRKSKEDEKVANKKKNAESSDEMPSEEKAAEGSSDEVASEGKLKEKESSDDTGEEE
jgi:small subunit ribosomal protein S16